jgi:anti-sigma-K factor RskA
MANNKSHNEKFEELCAGYVLNALDENERQEFEQLFKEASEKEKRFYKQMKSSAHQLAFTIEQSVPSASVKKQLMDKIRSEKDSGTNTTQTSIDERPVSTKETDTDESEFNWQAFAVAASFALLLVSLSLIFYSFNLSSKISEREHIIAEQQSTITELKTRLQQKEEMLSILEAREVDMVLMSGLEVNPDGYGKVIWDSETQKALLQVSNLPAVPKDKDYQLWLIKNNTPVSAGVFAVNDEGDKFFKIEKMADADEQSANAFAITMEPKGGMPQPTGDMYLMGSMEK